MYASATCMNAPRGAEISSNNISLFLHKTKEYIMQATTDNVKVISHNDGKAIKAAIKPTKELLSPTAIAQRLGLSNSYVYATIGKLELKPNGYQGKTHLYSEDVLGKFPVRQRQRRVTPKVVRRAEGVAIKSVVQDTHKGSLMERLDSLENLIKSQAALIEKLNNLVGA